ncbi:hypothetical protein F2P81_014377 [Scophthalmus maximus]|uniref:Secreted protein n=1 Tax=Scophthalmus maximus TaxID=52904 RepID=A0A6A4STE6_SCOMX|nr:hypothetical protein F2P81_014377 [Scophthalmus maximus]
MKGYTVTVFTFLLLSNHSFQSNTVKTESCSYAHFASRSVIRYLYQLIHNNHDDDDNNRENEINRLYLDTSHSVWPKRRPTINQIVVSFFWRFERFIKPLSEL